MCLFQFFPRLRWKVVRYLCSFLYIRHSITPVPETWGDPLKIFQETQVEGNIGRFLTYVVWLKQFPLASEWYTFVYSTYSENIPPLGQLVGAFLSSL